MSIAVQQLSPKELKQYLKNAQRLGREEIVVEILREMSARGIAQSDDFRSLMWNQETVRTQFAPFIDVAKAVPNNCRTPYTEAGGFKIGRSKDDPEKKWIDTYSAIKTKRLNAVFGCLIDRPGDDPSFQLIVDGGEAERFDAGGLRDALVRWRQVAALASDCD
jgi:hypothetical protein